MLYFPRSGYLYYITMRNSFTFILCPPDGTWDSATWNALPPTGDSTHSTGFTRIAETIIIIHCVSGIDNNNNKTVFILPGDSR